MNKDKIEKLIELYKEGLLICDYESPVINYGTPISIAEMLEDNKAYDDFMEKREEWNKSVKNIIDTNMHFKFDFPIPSETNEYLFHDERLKILHKIISSYNEKPDYSI